MSDTSANDVGLFVVSYEIGTELPGAPRLVVHLAVNAPRRSITGQGRLTQAVNPPLNLTMALAGDFTYLTVMPPEPTDILVVLSDVQGTNPNAPGIELRMLLIGGWAAGVASYRYTTARPGPWVGVDDVSVRQIQPAGAPADPVALVAH